MEWQPIDTAPTDGTEILCFIPDDSPDMAVCRYQNDRYWQGFVYVETLVNDVVGCAEPTHWMHKPDTPK